MLLRYFVNFYDMEIIEEEAFLAWKEDISQEFPGKGKALFQVLAFGICYNKLLFKYVVALENILYCKIFTLFYSALIKKKKKKKTI